MRRRHHGRRQRGSAVVEFALTMPLLLLVALAIIQVAIVARDRLVLQHAAREGARAAAVDADDAAVVAVAIRAASPLPAQDVDVVVERGGGLGQPVVVRVAYDAPIAMPLASWLLPDSVHVDAEMAMRQEFG